MGGSPYVKIASYYIQCGMLCERRKNAGTIKHEHAKGNWNEYIDS